MKMRPLGDGLEIPAGGSAKLQTGGNHLMFMKLREPMEVGQLRWVILEFEKAGKIQIENAGRVPRESLVQESLLMLSDTC